MHEPLRGGVASSRRTVGLTRPPTSELNKGPGEGDGSATGKVPHRVEMSLRTSKFSASAGAVVKVESVCRRCGGGNNNNVDVVSISVGGVGGGSVQKGHWRPFCTDVRVGGGSGVGGIGKSGGGGDGGNGGVSCVGSVVFVSCVCQSR